MNISVIIKFKSIQCLVLLHKNKYNKMFCKKLKSLGNVNRTNKENVINVLHGDEKKSYSGHYYESSFGKLKDTSLYAMTHLSLIIHWEKLINSPEVFYQKENLEKL